MPQQYNPGRGLRRRAFVGALAGGSGLALAGPAAATLSTWPQRKQIAFDIRRGGATIGRHAVAFQQRGEQLEVDVEIDIEVNLAFIPIFTYSHRNHEVWQDGRLVALDSETDDDGERFTVTARGTAEGLRVLGNDGEFLAPRSILPTSYWNPRTVEQSQLLDSQHGRLLKVTSEFRGSERLDGSVPARRYRLSGDLNLDLWYSGRGEWLKIAFEARGAEVSYARRVTKDSGVSG